MCGCGTVYLWEVNDELHDKRDGVCVCELRLGAIVHAVGGDVVSTNAVRGWQPVTAVRT